MPKIKSPKVGHLIKGEIEFTIVVEKVQPELRMSGEFKLATFASLSKAAHEARKQWMGICDKGEFLSSINVYYHTKGKTKYSQGHHKQINWVDFDDRNDNADARTAFLVNLVKHNPLIITTVENN